MHNGSNFSSTLNKTIIVLSLIVIIQKLGLHFSSPQQSFPKNTFTKFVVIGYMYVRYYLLTYYMLLTVKF